MINKLVYNWHQTGDHQIGFAEDFCIAEIGIENYQTKKVVKEIIEHRPAGEGDKWFYDVFFEDNTEMRVFNPSLVFKSK